MKELSNLNDGKIKEKKIIELHNFLLKFLKRKKIMNMINQL